jgi:hypothetical protein
VRVSRGELVLPADPQYDELRRVFNAMIDRRPVTCDNLLSVEVVLADGSVVRASDDENPYLFWGIRGGAGTSGSSRSSSTGSTSSVPMVLAGMVLWPIERARDVLRAWRDYVDAGPDELGSGAAIVVAPPEDFSPTT